LALPRGSPPNRSTSIFGQTSICTDVIHGASGGVASTLQVWC
jgi:hypothetical protein